MDIRRLAERGHLLGPVASIQNPVIRGELTNGVDHERLLEGILRCPDFIGWRICQSLDGMRFELNERIGLLVVSQDLYDWLTTED